MFFLYTFRRQCYAAKSNQQILGQPMSSPMKITRISRMTICGTGMTHRYSGKIPRELKPWNYSRRLNGSLSVRLLNFNYNSRVKNLIFLQRCFMDAINGKVAISVENLEGVVGMRGIVIHKHNVICPVFFNGVNDRGSDRLLL